MPEFEIGDTRLDYVEAGSGDPVLLIHGSVSDRRTWESQLEEFSHHDRVVAYSRRYHWPNERIPDGADYSMRQQVDDLQALLPILGDKPVHLVGHSYGTFLALLLALRDPSQIRSLVLVEPPAVTLFVSNQPKPTELLRLLFTRPAAAFAIMKFATQGVIPASKAARKDDVEEAISAFGPATLGREFYRKLSPERLKQVHTNFIKAELLGSGYEPLPADLVRSVSVPVMLITAEKSPSLFRHLAARLAELLPDTEESVIPNASHISQEDNPAGFNSVVLPFLHKH